MNKIDKKNIIENIVIFLIMIILFTIVLLSFYPGIIPFDGNNQWQQVVSNNIITNHPFFSTFFWWLIAKIWYSPTSLLVFQILLISIIWTYICKELRNDNNFIKQIIYTIFICFIPIIFMYVIIAWKDIIYSYNLIILSLMFFVGIKKNFQYSYKDLFIIVISLVWINNYRYNGIIVIVLSIITLLIIFLKHKLSYKKIIFFICILTSLFLICKIPEKLMYNENEKSQTGNDIILFILASLVKEDKIDNKSDLDLINSIYDIDALKEEYNPYLINSISISKNYNREIYTQNSSEIIKILIKYSIKNPLTIIKHYLKSDNILIGTSLKNDSYVYVFPFEKWDNEFNGNFDAIVNPIIKNGYTFYLGLVNFSTTTKFGKIFYMPGNFLYISIIFLIFYCKRMKNKSYILVSLPMIFNTLSLSLINVAQDLRYVYINYLTLFLIVIPIIIFNKRNKNKNMKECKINSNENPKTLVIIPAYNEEKSIEKVVNSVYEQNIENLDVIVINDGSKDNTYQEAKKTKAIIIDSPNNLGIGGAVQTGYLYAYKNDYDIAIQLDGDGQHDPKYLKDLINEIKDGNDLVIGSRFVNKTSYNQTFARMLGINIISGVIKQMTGRKIYDTTSGFRASDKSVIAEFVENYPYDYPEPCTNMSIIKKGYKIKEIPVEMRKRETGVSSISPIKAVSYMFKVTLSIFLMGLKEE